MSHNGWSLSPDHQALLSKISQESGVESRLPPPVDHTGNTTGLTVSVLAHLMLLAFFILGLNWKTEEPAAFEAVLWSSLPSKEKVAAEPTKPKPVSKPKPVKETPTPPQPAQPRKADIELPKNEKKPKSEPKKPEPPKKTEPKPEPKKTQQIKPEPESTIDPELAKKLRQEELARIMGGEPNTGSTSPGTSKNRAQYSDRIREYVRSKIVFPNTDSINGNPEVVFEVRQLPTGEITLIRQKKSSGLLAWDNAVERALQRSSPLPLPRTGEGSVEAVLVLSFRPKDI
jgi:colicin import membrane protein